MMSRNYQKELDTVIAREQSAGRTPTLLLHACCAPCSSYVLEYLAQAFAITVLYYNPNIAPEAEYQKRLDELKRFISAFPLKNPVKLIEGRYTPEQFYALAKGLEDENEGGERCARCYELRLREAAEAAAKGGFDYFTTTLSISPYKNAQKLNEIGERLAQEYGVRHLSADFKKKDGYKRSIALSQEYGLYRQDYCGCVYSKAQSERRHKENI
ncbi:epoxyqueuosine reductase QueH [Acetanaerobacterium elongatum]|uniref:Epoxyqueuosine reductase QueH n=1 Tax=Acetanaerobacterium elongatum TaxID=258515 RepID=A0A1G9V6K8_9FIRM|nr:epoxyqueuosine reductase QueH [Acetanaerobacterium elongatum]SDM67743.1 hypothetical protein SAMN05192585_10367 [Acetanaerobacterium elongatum]